MRHSNPKPSSSPSFNPQRSQFKITLIEDKTLLIRLSTEFDYLYCEARRAIPEIRRNPRAFARSCSVKAGAFAKCQMTPTNLIGFASAICVMVSLALLILAFDQVRNGQKEVVDVAEDGVRPVLLVMTAATNGPPSIYPGSTGRVGVASGSGEGSGPTPARAGGGGSGGMDDLTPEQIGKVPPPSVVPAMIPKNYTAIAPSLPAAGVDLDPLLWQDVKFPQYGNPQSRWNIPSNGSGTGGGMGPNTGLGVGDGSGNGYGEGDNGNTGSGPRKPGNGGGGGAAGGMSLSTPLRSHDVDQKVRLLSKPEPHYTEEARRNGISGTVVLRVVFASTGEITNIRALQTLPFGLTERAIAAAREIKFIPAMKGARPVSVYMQLEYNFNLY